MKNTKNKNIYWSIFIIIVLLSLILSFLWIKNKNTDTTITETDTSNVYYLPVFETTDIHGYIVDISSGKEETYQYRLGFIANLIDELREEGDILLVDTGDCYQGNALSNKLQGQPIRAYTDIMDYDGICLGNHEFDWGLGTEIDHDATVGSYNLSDSIKGDSDVPVLCWNLYDTSTGEKVDFTRDYVIVEKNAKSLDGKEKKIKIAILGYINDYSSSINKNAFEGYEIHEEEIAEVEKKARELEESGEADVTVMTCHVCPEQMAPLVGENSVVDLIVCGHNHLTGTGKFSNGVPYILGGCYGQSYATATIAVTEEGDVSIENQQYVYIVDDKEQLYDNEENRQNFDDAVMDISHTTIDIVREKYPDVLEGLGYITTDLSRDRIEGSIGEDIATNWAAQVRAEAVGAQVGITNSTGVRAKILLQDDEKTRVILGSDIYNMFPFDNKIMEYSITYEQLLDLCNNTKINYYSYVGVSGVTAYFDDGVDSNLNTLYLGDEKIYDNGWIADKNTTVTVAADDYSAGNRKFCLVNLDPINDYENTTDNVAIIEYLRENYGLDKEIVIDTNIHLHDGAEQ